MAHSEYDRSRQSTLLLLQVAATCDNEASLRNRIPYQLRTLDAEFLLKNGRISFIVSLRIWNHCVRLQMIIVCHMKRYGG